MRAERQRAVLERYLRFRAGELPDCAAASVRAPAAAYTDPQRFGRELQILFRQHPLPVAVSADCRGPGSYVATWAGDVPIVLIRQRDGTLRGYVNACRHRGAPVLTGRGDGLRAVICPYHAWTYGLDGRLQARPLEWGFADVGRSECSLAPVAVAEQYGLVFACTDARVSISVDALLAGMQSELAEYELAGYVHFETRSREWPFNWKLVIDTFTEPYHIPALHQRSIASDYDFRHAVWDPFGLGQRTVNFRSSIERELSEKPAAERTILPHTTIEYFLLPNTVLTHQLDHFELWRALPLSVDRTLVTTSLYAPGAPCSDAARRHWQKNLDRLLQVTETEDFPMMVQIQRALASGAVPELIYGKLEPALVHFHRSLDALLAQDD